MPESNAMQSAYDQLNVYQQMLVREIMVDFYEVEMTRF